MDKSVNLILERTHPHPVIVNPYKNYFDFYKKYWIYKNSLQKELITPEFLKTCVNKSNKNYYDEYYRLFKISPYYEKKYGRYFLTDRQVENILYTINKHFTF